MSPLSRKKLEDHGLTIWAPSSLTIVYKKAGQAGNMLPKHVYFPIVNIETSVTTNLESSCPFIQFWLHENKYRVISWNWVPGPGPGDFDLEFSMEHEAIEFIISYYFGKNEYFEARKIYEESQLKSQS